VSIIEKVSILIYFRYIPYFDVYAFNVWFGGVCGGSAVVVIVI